MKFKDYYRILGVAPDASADAIKTAYRKLARTLHPDVNKGKDAQARFAELGEAYEALKDDQRRAAYDQLRAAGFKEGQEMDLPPPPPPGARGQAAAGGGFGGSGGRGFPGGGFGGFGGFGDDAAGDADQFSDFFQALFGAGRRGRGAQRGAYRERGEDLHHPLQVGLEEAYAGGRRTLQLEVPATDGPGTVARTIQVAIPAGVGNGTRIRLRGQGLPGSTPDLNGDLYLEVELAPHAWFRVDGRDIHLDLPVAPWEAVLGATVPTPTLGGTVSLNVPAGSQAGARLRLRGRGLPGQPPGDQLVTLVIVVPPRPGERERALYRDLAAAASGFDPRTLIGTIDARS